MNSGQRVHDDMRGIIGTEHVSSDCTPLCPVFSNTLKIYMHLSSKATTYQLDHTNFSRNLFIPTFGPNTNLICIKKQNVNININMKRKC